MSIILKQAEQIANIPITVLILGETGVGKGVLARHIHSLGLRQERPFVSVNCGALPSGVAESELFGHEKGSFTSAVNQHIGRFEQAYGGTLFLDEIGDLNIEVQRLLLNILEDHHLTRVGGEASIKVDARVIAATNRDLQQSIQDGTFRQDLFQRLNMFPIEIPPLRERQEEIPDLAVLFATEWAQKLRRPVPSLSNEVMRHLQEYDWPGNVRELEHLIQRAMIICLDDAIQVEHMQLPAGKQAAALTSRTLVEREAEAKTDRLAEAEERQIIEALQATNWTIYGEQGAAQLLGIKPERLRSRMRVYGLQRPKNPHR